MYECLTCLLCRYRELATYLQNPQVREDTKHAMERIHRLCNTIAPQSDNLGIKMVNIRPILACWIIIKYPVDVFEELGQLEEDLLASANQFYDNTYRILELISSGVPISDVPRDIVSGFGKYLFQYLDVFYKWKEIDEKKLLERLKDALTRMYTARRWMDTSLPEFPQMDQTIARLRSRLMHIGGNETLAAFDVNRTGINRYPRVGRLGPDISYGNLDRMLAASSEPETVPPIMTVELAVDVSLVATGRLTIKISHGDSVEMCYHKITLGLCHALPNSPEQQRLLDLLQRATRNGGAAIPPNPDLSDDFGLM